MMFLTESQLKKIRELRHLQFVNREKQVVPTIHEVAQMRKKAPNMTLDDYLALSDDERRKWMISANPRDPTQNLGFDEKLGEDVYYTSFFFEPWTSNEHRKY